MQFSALAGNGMERISPRRGAPAGTQRSGSGGEKEGQRSGVCEDVSNWMSLDSDPWGLEPGENVVVISSDAVADTPVTFLKYRVLYLGV